MYFLGHGRSLSVSQEILKSFVIGKTSEYWIIACPEVDASQRSWQDGFVFQF
jgi:hypothetical protein